MMVGPRHRPHRGWKPVAASVTRPRMSLSIPQAPGPSPHQQGRGLRRQSKGSVGIERCRRTGSDVLLFGRLQVSRIAMMRQAGMSHRPAAVTARRGDRGSSRAAAPSAVSSAPCSPPASRCAASILRRRQFAGARGALAKNDRLDVRLIAAYVATMPTHVVRHDPAAARIAEIVTVRRQLCDEHVAIENQAAQLEDAMLLGAAVKRRLARIETDIRLLDKRLTQMIAAEADLARRYARLTSMPGVGPVAFTLIALLPELGRMSRNRAGRSRALRFRQRQAAGTPQHLRRTHAGPKRPLHGGPQRLPLQPRPHVSTTVSPPPARSPRSSLSPHAQDDHHVKIRLSPAGSQLLRRYGQVPRCLDLRSLTRQAGPTPSHTPPDSLGLILL